MTRDLSVPRHLAIVMDGNGRWAKKRHLPRFFGHKAGVDGLLKVIKACADRGVEYLVGELEAIRGRGVGPDGFGAGSGDQVPRQAGR